jgi:hypothetical protein
MTFPHPKSLRADRGTVRGLGVRRPVSAHFVRDYPEESARLIPLAGRARSPGSGGRFELGTAGRAAAAAGDGDFGPAMEYRMPAPAGPEWESARRSMARAGPGILSKRSSWSWSGPTKYPTAIDG